MPKEKPAIYWVLQSRKFWSAVVGLVAILYMSLVNGAELDPDTVVNAILGIVAAYMATTAWEDSSKAEAAGRVSAAETAASTTTVSTPGASDVTVTKSDENPTQPMLGRMG